MSGFEITYRIVLNFSWPLVHLHYSPSTAVCVLPMLATLMALSLQAGRVGQLVQTVLVLLLLARLLPYAKPQAPMQPSTPASA